MKKDTWLNIRIPIFNTIDDSEGISKPNHQKTELFSFMIHIECPRLHIQSVSGREFPSLEKPQLRATATNPSRPPRHTKR